MSDEQTQGSPAIETGWVIEGDACYWNGASLDSKAFVRKPEDAVRFARKQDAIVVKERLFEPHAFALRVSQHTWIDGIHQ